MPIPFVCPLCNNQAQVADQHAGQVVACPHCNQSITAPGIEYSTSVAAQGQPFQQGQQPHPQGQSQFSQPMTQNYQPMPGYPQQKENDTAMRMLLPVDRSGLAIVAGYLGLFSVICIAAPFALVIGILAVRDIKKNPKKHGLGRAWFGIIMGALGTVGFVVMIVAGIASNM